MELINNIWDELEGHWTDLKRQRDYFTKHSGRLEVQGHEAKVRFLADTCTWMLYRCNQNAL